MACLASPSSSTSLLDQTSSWETPPSGTKQRRLEHMGTRGTGVGGGRLVVLLLKSGVIEAY